MRSRAGPNTRAPVAALSAGDAADVIGMMMRRENCFERESFRGEHRQHRPGIARIDDGDRARVGAAANHPDVVVAERRDRPHVEHA